MQVEDRVPASIVSLQSSGQGGTARDHHLATGILVASDLVVIPALDRTRLAELVDCHVLLIGDQSPPSEVLTPSYVEIHEPDTARDLVLTVLLGSPSAFLPTTSHAAIGPGDIAAALQSPCGLADLLGGGAAAPALESLESIEYVPAPGLQRLPREVASSGLLFRPDHSICYWLPGCIPPHPHPSPLPPPFP